MNTWDNLPLRVPPDLREHVKKHELGKQIGNVSGSRVYKRSSHSKGRYHLLQMFSVNLNDGKTFEEG